MTSDIFFSNLALDCSFKLYFRKPIYANIFVKLELDIVIHDCNVPKTVQFWFVVNHAFYDTGKVVDTKTVNSVLFN